MNVLGIIQARMGSSRLPGKVYKDLAGEPMFVRVINRVKRAQTVDEVIIATSMHPADESISHLCGWLGIGWYRGSETDVLDRYYRAAIAFQADVIVRITADCPLIDPDVIDHVVGVLLERRPRVDYVNNALPGRTYPRGLDVEAFTFQALEAAWREDKDPAWREHVTPYMLNNPDKFKLLGVNNTEDHSAMRWTVDTEEDLQLVRNVYDHFGHDDFSWCDVLELMEQNPDWLEINSHIVQKAIPEQVQLSTP